MILSDFNNWSRFPERVELHQVGIPKRVHIHIEKALPLEPDAKGGYIWKKTDCVGEEFLV